MQRREYTVSLNINDIQITKVIIDPHYEEKHSESIDDQTILKLVAQLDGKDFDPQDEKDSFQYFVSDRLKLDGKLYKLVWLLEEDQIYVGVLNAYRR